jgi:hypothetical protein
VLFLFKGWWGGGATPHGLIFVKEVFGGLGPTHRQSGRQAKGLLLPLGKSAFFFDKKGPKKIGVCRLFRYTPFAVKSEQVSNM